MPRFQLDEEVQVQKRGLKRLESLGITGETVLRVRRIEGNPGETPTYVLGQPFVPTTVKVTEGLLKRAPKKP